MSLCHFYPRKKMSTTPNEIYTNFKAYDFESPKFDNYG